MRWLKALLVPVLIAVMAPAASAHWPASIDETVTPGGEAEVASPTLPAGATSATVDVDPKEGSGDVFGQMGVVLSGEPRNQRIVTCAIWFYSLDRDLNGSVAADVPLNPLPFLLLKACLEVFVSLDQQTAAQRTATAAGGPCRNGSRQVPAQIKRVGRRYSAHIEGAVGPLKARGKVKITCRRHGAGVRIKVRPTRKGQLLRKAVGPKVLVGLYNPRAATGSAAVRLTFRQ